MKTFTWQFLKMGISGWRSLLFMFIWILSNFALFLVGYLEQRNDPGLFKLNDPIGTSVYMSRGAGLCLMFQAMLILLPVCRNILSLLREVRILRYVIVFDKNIHFHKIVAWTMLFFTGVHSISHMFNLNIVDRIRFLGPDRTAVQIAWTHPAGITAIVMLVCMFLMYTTAMEPIRKQCFELFWYMHHLAFPFMIALCLHSSGCFVKEVDGKCKPYGTYKVALTGIVIYTLERVLREWKSRGLTYCTKVIEHPGRTIELQFKKVGFSYLSGQYIFICIPQLSKYQWHPYTLTSTPEEEYISVHIRVVGDWTQQLEHLCQSGEMPQLRIDGPFGTPSQEVFDEEHVVLVGAGIGVTPFASILKSIWYRQRIHLTLKTVHFFWICRETEAFEWFHSLLSAMEKECPFLNIHIYLTKSLDPSFLNHIYLDSPNKDADTITKLRSRTHFGRPNWQSFFKELKGEVGKLGGSRVGVFLCGPEGLKQSVREACVGESSREFYYEFHCEKF